jgi:hypothetical protein
MSQGVFERQLERLCVRREPLRPYCEWEITSSTCYTKQNNKERYWIAWTQNGRVIRWGSFCERLRHGSTFIIKSDQHAGLDNLSPLHEASPHELEDIPSLALW